MCGLGRRIGARQGQHFGDRCHIDRCLVGLAASLARQPLDALLGIVTLPAPTAGRLTPDLREISSAGSRSAE
jgi:hypothetical protein